MAYPDGDAPGAEAPAMQAEIYDRLRRLAHRQLAGRHDTLNTTALVHEAWISLARGESRNFKDDHHFLSYAAVAMRHILVDHARRRGARKRGENPQLVDWSDHDVPVDDIAAGVLALDSALLQLSELDQRLGRVVELRFFGGLPVEDVAGILGVTTRSVVRDWQKARMFLHAAIGAAP